MTERIMMGLLLGGVAFGCGAILYPFMSALLWAAILTFATWPIYVRIRRNMGPVVGAVIMTVLTTLVVAVPLVIVVSSSIADLPGTFERLTTSLTSFHLPAPTWLSRIPLVGPDLANKWTQWATDLGHAEHMLLPYAGNIAQSMLSGLMLVASGLVHLGMALFIAFFFWLGGDALGATFAAVIRRIAGAYADRIIGIIGRTIRGTVYGILGTAIIQGVLTGLGFAMTGLPQPVLFGMITAGVAVLPIGAPLIWIPGALALMLTHHLWRGICLVAFGTFIISGADHVIRPMFISRGAQLPYLLTVLGVLGGVWTFGALGIFLGPVLLGVGYTLTAEFAANAPGRAGKNARIEETFIES
ncbi:AI-2E family transporter [Gluconacetobacter asukensis]|uniref:AI-2E family transporter n=1 Tax=Gluconacetobacter asukensis TaxID=1017181 RepID=A0A7W4P2N1_9PROT|nr:AI-2E family transporter [Gluconacetobacter asukensis]MBB2171915.1 AI-2E family transporter [Gluconacetobacter asukensis]